MSQCRVCEGHAQLFLCITHITSLRDALRDLPWWLRQLEDSAVGNVRLGEGGRKGTRAHELDEYTGPDGAEKLEKARNDGKFALDKALAAGRVNAKASRLLGSATNDLGTWVRHICETRGVEVPALNVRQCAKWMEKHTHAIASDEAAAECYNTIVDLTDQIRKIVNRAEPPEFCGPCDGELTAEQRTKLVTSGEEDRTHCRVQLYARRGLTRVTCRDCGKEHDIAELQAAMLEEADEYSFSITDLADFILPKLDIRVPRRTLQYWAKVGAIIPTGWDDKIARFQLADVREVARTRKNGRASIKRP